MKHDRGSSSQSHWGRAPRSPAKRWLPHAAEAQADGLVGPEHLRVIERFFDQLPNCVDYQTRELAEADLARIGSGLGPRSFAKPPFGSRP